MIEPIIIAVDHAAGHHELDVPTAPVPLRSWRDVGEGGRRGRRRHVLIAPGDGARDEDGHLTSVQHSVWVVESVVIARDHRVGDCVFDVPVRPMIGGHVREGGLARTGRDGGVASGNGAGDVNRHLAAIHRVRRRVQRRVNRISQRDRRRVDRLDVLRGPVVDRNVREGGDADRSCSYLAEPAGAPLLHHLTVAGE